MKGFSLSTLCFVLIAGALSACVSPPGPTPAVHEESRVLPTYRSSQVREPLFAGQFYPGQPEELERTVAQYLSQAVSLGVRPLALIAPHAGYVYSGQVAAHAFRQVKGWLYEVIVIIAPNHTTADFRDISVYAEGAFGTPLGELPVDTALAQRLIAAHERIVYDPRLHRYEHAIEVELPFVQMVAADTPIVPIVMGEPTRENCRILCDALTQALAGQNALVVASSDMSHYPAYEDAQRIDGRMLAAIESLDVEKVWQENASCLSAGVPNLACTLCGLGPVVTAIMYAQQVGANQATVLSYCNSGDAPLGDHRRVVGYGAVMFWRWEPPHLDEAEKQALLKLAREAIRAHLEHKPALSFEPTSPDLRQPSGVFVTLRKEGKLRGCIGHILPREPLYAAVQSVAIAAAVGDPRFSPLTARELAETEIEISVLSPLRRVSGIEEIKVGTHGLYIRRGQAAGLLLPQVATEQGWDRLAFLQGVCRKAGLPEDAWQDEATALYTFTAEIFAD